MTQPTLARALIPSSFTRCFACANNLPVRNGRLPLAHFKFVHGLPVVVCDEHCQEMLTANWMPTSLFIVR